MTNNLSALLLEELRSLRGSIDELTDTIHENKLEVETRLVRLETTSVSASTRWSTILTWINPVISALLMMVLFTGKPTSQLTTAYEKREIPAIGASSPREDFDTLSRIGGPKLLR